MTEKAEKKIFLSLGSNLGNREKNLQTAVQKLSRSIRIEAVSSVYETSPVDFYEQPPFFNMCLKAAGSSSAHDLLKLIEQIEQEGDRKRDIKKGPRTIDIDIIFFGTQKIQTPVMTIPHPAYTKRLFVLIPLLEIAPDFADPNTNTPLIDYAKQIDTAKDKVVKVSRLKFTQ